MVPPNEELSGSHIRDIWFSLLSYIARIIKLYKCAVRGLSADMERPEYYIMLLVS